MKYCSSFNETVLILSGFLLLLSVLACFGELHWSLELLSSLRLQLLACFGLCALITIFQRSHNAVLYGILAAGLCLNGADLLPYYWQHPATQASPKKNREKPLTWLQANLFEQNVGLQRFFETLRQFSPDLVSLEEVSWKWRQTLEREPLIRQAYPYRYFSPKFGLALLSRQPLRNARTEEIFPQEPFNELLVAEGGTVDKPLQLMVVHPEHATDADEAWRQQAVVDAIVRRMHNRHGAKVIAGDFNMAPGSTQFQHLIRSLDLKDTAYGSGLLPSWPCSLPWLFRVPIDHILVSEPLHADSCTLLRSIGSDHLPVLCRMTY